MQSVGTIFPKNNVFIEFIFAVIEYKTISITENHKNNINPFGKHRHGIGRVVTSEYQPTLHLYCL